MRDPRWEAVTDDDGAMCRVRWSEPDQEGRYLWVGHYPGGEWGRHAAESQAERFNDQKRCPWEFHAYKPRVTVENVETEMSDNLNRVKDILETVLAVEVLEYHDSNWLSLSPATRNAAKQLAFQEALEKILVLLKERDG